MGSVHPLSLCVPDLHSLVFLGFLFFGTHPNFKIHFGTITTVGQIRRRKVSGNNGSGRTRASNDVRARRRGRHPASSQSIRLTPPFRFIPQIWDESPPLSSGANYRSVGWAAASRMLSLPPSRHEGYVAAAESRPRGVPEAGRMTSLFRRPHVRVTWHARGPTVQTSGLAFGSLDFFCA